MKKRIKTGCAVLCAVLAAATVTYAAASAGSSSDPLVTLGYLTNRFTPQMKTVMEELVSQKEKDLTEKFNQQIASVPTGGQAGESVFAVVTLSEGQVLTGEGDVPSGRAYGLRRGGLRGHAAGGLRQLCVRRLHRPH